MILYRLFIRGAASTAQAPSGNEIVIGGLDLTIGGIDITIG